MMVVRGVVVVGTCILGFAACGEAWEMLPSGSIRPEGRLREMCRKAADGYLGHMEEVDRGFAEAWNESFTPCGWRLDWAEAQRHGELGALPAELGAYWWDGLVRLAWALDDAALKAKCHRAFATLKARMHPKSIGFCWWLNRDCPEDWAEIDRRGYIMGAGARLARAFNAYARATGDKSALRAISYAMDDYRFWKYGNPISLPAAAYETWRLTGDVRIGRCLDEFAGYYDANWGPMRYRKPVPLTGVNGRAKWGDCEWRVQHGVMFEESAVSFLALAQKSGRKDVFGNVISWFEEIDRWAMQPQGVIVADEFWGYRSGERGTETCVVAGEIWSGMNLLAATGDGRWGDRVERAVFNAAPACVNADFTQHVYKQTPNRRRKDEKFPQFSFHTQEDEGTAFARKHMPLCCTASQNRLLPLAVESLWMRTPDGFAATGYGPCRLEFGGLAVRETTDYPYEETVRFEIVSTPDGGWEGELRFRIPGWCKSPAVSRAYKMQDGFARVRRRWRTGDVLKLRLPMSPRIEVWRDYNGDDAREVCHFSHGPVLYALPDPGEAAVLIDVNKVRPEVFASRRMRVNAADGGRLELVPFADAELRISVFDVVRSTPKVHGEEDGGRLIKVRSPSMDKDIDVMVITPRGYGHDPARRFPVVYLLHGASDNFHHGELPIFRELADRYGVIVVCPNGTRTWWMDSPVKKESRYATFVARELVSFVDAHYRTAVGREYRGLTGNSMGGYGAVSLALRYPSTFSRAASIFGGFDVWDYWDSGEWGLVDILGNPATHEANWRENTAIRLAQDLKDGELSLYLCCGTDDLFIKPNRAFHEFLTSRRVQHTYVEKIGCHSVEFFMEFYPECFRFMSFPR